jgi:hypothetical protein
MISMPVVGTKGVWGEAAAGGDVVATGTVAGPVPELGRPGTSE